MNDSTAKVFPFPSPGSPPGGAAERLDSWKGIAAYLSRGTRTVQRWERLEGLPVHRLRHDQGSNVFAYKKELDSWWAGRQSDLAAEPSAEDPTASIAVLPFSDLSREKDQDYFGEGIAEELINALAHLRGLRVVARTSAFALKGLKLDIREIGRKLDVRTVLEGSVRKAGDRLRVTAQLINVEDGFHLWSQRYDMEMHDVFAIQDEITAAIVENLKVKLLAGETAALRKRSTEDPEAYNFYLKGKTNIVRIFSVPPGQSSSS